MTENRIWRQSHKVDFLIKICYNIIIMKIPKQLKPIFWDIDLQSIDVNKHQNFLIARIAEKGRWKDVQWLKKQFSLSDIKKIIKKSRSISDKTKNYWQTI